MKSSNKFVLANRRTSGYSGPRARVARPRPLSLVVSRLRQTALRILWIAVAAVMVAVALGGPPPAASQPVQKIARVGIQANPRRAPEVSLIAEVILSRLRPEGTLKPTRDRCRNRFERPITR